MDVVDPHVEAAVLWLAETILEVLFAGKMEEWIRQVGLADDVERFKSEIERVEAVVTYVKGRAAENRPLARSLGRLKELLYDADDMVDEVDYYRLQHQVEGVTFASAIEPEGMDGDGAEQVDASRNNAGMLSSSNKKKRSKVWEDFRVTETADGKPVKAECIHCHIVLKCGTSNGTSVMHNHLKSGSCKEAQKRAARGQTPNPSSVDDGAENAGAIVPTHDSDSRKRKRVDELSAHDTPANTHIWNKAEFCSRIQQTTEQLRKVISEVQELHGSGSIACSNLCQNTAADACRRTSSLIQHKMYGRVTEKNSILQLMTECTSDGLLILPIVGIGGIGKTAIAQVVYNDPIVKSQFDHRIWIWVSSNFNEVKLTTEMLNFVSQECVGITNLAKLQEILVSHVTSKRTLLILDDFWDNIDICRWNKLLAPLRSDNAKDNVIIVTTRKLSIAKRIGTVKPVKLGRLQNDDFWLLFKTCSFGDESYEEHPSLTLIGQQIAKNLHGNPLAAQTAGMLLREHLTTDHWSNILKNEKWKSQHLNGGIMHSLKLSYDELPYYLHQCFLYCSIFPNNHWFKSSELVCIWISQGFVKCSHSTERLEEIGRNYLTDLLHYGFFEQVETKYPTLGNQTFYVVMPALVHEFARLVSVTECASIDDLACREVLPTVRHLSIITYSAYHEDKYGNILRNEKFEEKLQRVVNSTRKLRTLVLIGKYDYYFLQSLRGLLQKEQNLRTLKISAAYADFGYSVCNLVNSTHVRFLKLRAKEDNEALPEALSKFYHLQVLDIGSDRYSTVTNGTNNLINLRHLVASKAVYSSISSIGKMTSLQELHDFKVDNCTSFEIAQLQSMSELAQISVSQLEKVVTRDEAYGANLQEKNHLEKLHLSWEYTSQDEHDNNMISEHSYEAVEIGTSKVVLEGLEPHHDLKSLHISGYRSGTFPDWLVSTVSVTSLQTLHLEDCRELQVLPSLERLPLLTKLKLNNMSKVTQVTVPSLEELVLIEMPQLESCSCKSVRDLNSSLRVLIIEKCHVLKVFPLFERSAEPIIEQKSWLSGLSDLTIHDCPHLTVSHTLPPSSSVCRLSIARVPTLPAMEGSTNGNLTIDYDKNISSNNADQAMKVDDKFLSFHGLRDITSLQLKNCWNISSISLKGFSQLISLKILKINDCKNVFSSDVLLEHAWEDMANTNFNAFPSLEYVKIEECGITGKWLSVMLRHAPALEELYLSSCNQISGLSVEGRESSSSNHTSTSRAPSAGNPDGTLISSTPEGTLRIPSIFVSSLKKMSILWCKELTFQGNEEDFSRFSSLEELTVWGCPNLIPSLVQKNEYNDQQNRIWLLPHSLVELDIDTSQDRLQPCFLEDSNCLRKLVIRYFKFSMKFLQLRSCTALEELKVDGCESVPVLGNFSCLKKLVLGWNSGLGSLSSCIELEEFMGIALEDFMANDCQSLAALEGDFTCLKQLVLRQNPRLESLQLYSCTALEELEVYDCRSLAALKGNFTSLRKLVLKRNPMLKSLHLHACTALEDLRIRNCESLDALEDFGSLRGLGYLGVLGCPRLTERLLSQDYGLCAGLEMLKTDDYSFLTTSFCEGLASLQRLVLNKVTRLTDEQERALQLLTSLQELRFEDCYSLEGLPVVLPTLSSLKELEICSCSGISRLAEKDLPPSLEELHINDCDRDLEDQCRTLATTRSKPRVKINGKYVN